MRIKSNKQYIDYLDHTVSGKLSLDDSVMRLRFDLLLFSEDTLCMSVPACVKLDSTTNALMRLTPFWKAGKIRLILDNKHRNNPWNYFNNRKRVLEKGFREQDLLKHFEYTAYASPHTDYFYNTYISEVINVSKNELYIDKAFDTDESFRQAIIMQVNRNSDEICSKIPINYSLHMGKIFNELLIISHDRKLLFQRTAIEKKLIDEHSANQYEINIVSKILDKGFAYANGISCYAVPLSLVTNRLTGRKFISILKSTDVELYEIIKNLSWSAIYRLSINDTWLDFIDHLNHLFLLYQDSEKRKEKVFRSTRIEASLVTQSLVNKLYESALDALQVELFNIGSSIIDIVNIKNYSDKLVEHFLFNKSEYWDIIRQIDELIPALKVVICSLDRKYKDSTILLKDKGYIVSLDEDLF